jgi:hypothetical protein
VTKKTKKNKAKQKKKKKPSIKLKLVQASSHEDVALNFEEIKGKKYFYRINIFSSNNSKPRYGSIF